MTWEEIIKTNIFNISLFLFQLSLIYLLSSQIHNQFFYLIRKFFVSDKITMYIVAFLFGIGTLIHELSHAIFSILMGGRVSSVSLIPKLTDKGTIKYGHVEVEVLDPFRNTVVGIAPFIVGTTCIYFLSTYLTIGKFDWFNLLLLFIIFQISNSMFLSSSDLVYLKKLFWIFLTLFILYLVAEYFIFDYSAFLIPLVSNFVFGNNLIHTLNKLNFAFVVPSLINLFIFFSFKIVTENSSKRY
jgi:hypothetical protein